MRNIVAPKNTELETDPPQTYKFKISVREFVLAHPKWLTEEWQKALERVRPLCFLEEGQSMPVHDQDWDKLNESALALSERIPTYARLAVMPMLQAITCAPRLKEADLDAAPEPKSAKKAPK